MMRGPTADDTVWVDGLTIGEALREVARRYPEREALVFPEQEFRVDYRRYDELVDEVARGLLALGVERGDRVAIWSTNRPEWVLVQLATARIGAVLVTVNTGFREDELRYVLRQSDARVLLVTDRFKSSDYFERVSLALPELVGHAPCEARSAAAPDLRWVVSLADGHPEFMLGWDEMLAGGREPRLVRALAEREAILAPSDPINLQYTSGTTGFPKGAALSHRNLLLNAWYVGEGQHLTEADRVCSPVPLYHCFGCVIGVLCSMVHGACHLVPAAYFDPEATLDCLEKESATALYGVPTMFIALLEDPSFAGRDLSSLRTGVMAGAPCPVELMRRVIDDLGARQMTIAYGLTETSPCATQTHPDDDLETRVHTVGRPLPGVEVSVRDTVTGEPCVDGEQGEICIRGHNVMIGYHGMPEATAATIDRDGWLHSGDLGERDRDGTFRITGRLKDMIIRGGENVYPREIEEILYTHPEVEEAEVVGIPDPRFGEEIVAWVKLRGGHPVEAEELREYCRERLAHFKVPRHFIFTDTFPTTSSGKVQKFKLRERTLERLVSEEASRAVQDDGVPAGSTAPGS